MPEEMKMKKLHERQVLPNFPQQHIMNIFLPTIQNSRQKRNDLFGATFSLTFHQAARDGQYNIVKQYLNLFGKDRKKINKKDDEQTSALHYAVRYGHLSVVKLLVENGANVNIQGEYNATPLHYASRYIIEKKKSPYVSLGIKDEQTPIKKHNHLYQHLKLHKIHSTSSNKSLLKSAKMAFQNSKKKLQSFSSITQHKSLTNSSYEKMDTSQSDTKTNKLYRDFGYEKFHRYMYEHMQTKSKMKVVVILDELTENETKFIKNVDALILPAVKNFASSEIIAKSFSLRDKLNEIGLEKSISAVDYSTEFLKENNLKKKESSKYSRTQDAFQEDSILKYLLDQKPIINAKDFYDSTPLHYAAMRGNKHATEQLLAQKHINLEATDQSKMTPLHCAALYGSYDVCYLLLEHGANILCKDKESMTPVHFAAREGHFEIVRLFLDHAEKRGGVLMLAKVLFSCDQDEQTAFHLAVEKNHIKIVDLFIKKGSKVNSTKANLVSPLHLASTSGFIEIAKLLVTNGAVIESKNLLKETPLHRAAMFNRLEIIEYLLSKGAQIDCRDKDNETPLLMAVRKNNVESVKVLLDHLADITAKDLNDKTCLFIAAEANSKDAFELLCQYGAQSFINDFDKYEMTPLHIAAKEGHDIIVQALLSLGAKIDAKSEENLTPLHLAAKYGHSRIVKILLSNVLSIVKDVDISSNTPLHLAAIQGHVKVVELLIKNGAAVDARNAGLWTPLDCAAFHGWNNCVQTLLDADSHVNPVDKKMISPLQLACKKGHVDVVKLLLLRNADVSWKDHLGRNCLDYAVDNKQREAAVTIIASDSWKIALRNTIFEGNKLTTPMRKLIKKLPDVAELVFNKCLIGNGLPSDHPKYKVTCNYEFLEDLFTPWGPNAMNFSEYKKQHHNALGLPANKTSFAAQLARKIKVNCGLTNIDVKQNHTLEFMIKNHRTMLLCHPLVTYLLRRKWRSCGRYVYYSRLFLYIVFLLFVTSYALSLRANHHSIECQNTETNETQCFCRAENLPPTPKFFINYGGKFALVLSAMSLIIELIKLLYEAHHYFHVQRSIELAAYICSTIFTLQSYSNNGKSSRCSGQYDSLGAATITLSWLALVLFLRKFPKLGIYVVMFTHVFKSFMQFSLVVLLFAVSFGFALHLVLFNEKPISFSTPSRVILKALMGMMGEYNFDGLFNQSFHPSDIAWVIYITFLIISCFALMKFLIALAVDDIEGVQKQAVLNRLVMLVDLTLNVEKALPVSLQRKLAKMEESIYPNMRKSWSIWSFWSLEDHSRSLDKKGDLKTIKKEHKKLKETVYGLRTRMKAMEAQNNRIESLLNFVIKRLGVNK